MTFAQVGQRFDLSDERIENEKAHPDREEPYFYFAYLNGRPYLNPSGTGQRQLLREDVNPEQSILSQRRDPDSYPEITYLGDALRKDPPLPGMVIWALYATPLAPAGGPAERLSG